jgi:hypothetical protein
MMTTLHSFEDSSTGRFANVRMDNGDPCFIGVAQTGVIVNKSKVGFFGAKLYDEKNVYHAAMTAIALSYLYPEQLPPIGMTNPVLKAFTNAVLHCTKLAEVTRILNEAVQDAERQSGRPIQELQVIPD